MVFYFAKRLLVFEFLLKKSKRRKINLTKWELVLLLFNNFVKH